MKITGQHISSSLATWRRVRLQKGIGRIHSHKIQYHNLWCLGVGILISSFLLAVSMFSFFQISTFLQQLLYSGSNIPGLWIRRVLALCIYGPESVDFGSSVYPLSYCCDICVLHEN